MSSNPQFTSIQSVLVIGGCGFLGHHIVKQLLEFCNAKVYVLDLHIVRNRFPNVSYHSGDITSPTDVKAVLAQIQPQVIIHTASPPAIPPNPALYQKVNVDGTRNLLDCAAATPSVYAFVYTSSASIVHDNVSDLINADESFPVLFAPQQREEYAITKAVADGLALGANRQKGSNMKTISIRPAGLFGEGDSQTLPGMITAYEKGQTNFQIGDGTNLFDWTYVGNVAYAHLLAADALLNDIPGVEGEAFFITNDEPAPFWHFARAVWAAAGDTTEPSKIWVIPKDPGLMLASMVEWACWLVGTKPNLTRQVVTYSCTNRTYSCAKAKRVLGYKPLVSLQDGITRGVKFVMAERAAARAEAQKKA